MPIHSYQDKLPKLGERVFVAPSAHLTGDVEVGDDSSFWFHTAARGDVHWIRIGARTNIQDGSILHVTHQTHPLAIGAGVVIAHSCMIHGCTLEDGCLIGIGARVLDGAVIERGAQVGAGAVVTPGLRVPAGMLAVGVPAKVLRPLSDAERDNIAGIAERYVGVKDRYLSELGRGY
ncbi:MAG: gamma carbonic anhydrase family protein [Thermoanaerobaculia bacterium]|nr:MAG: gamma carbonic anhydrase family protein [Thermoanaerobaculia bacterium]